jgi:transcriptional regulator with XRE-family HTH domain
MKPKGNTFRGQIAAAVEGYGRSRYALAKATGLEQSTLSRLVSGLGWIGKEGMDALAAELGMTVTVKRKKGTVNHADLQTKNSKRGGRPREGRNPPA